jgi:GxxExxY protein
MNDELTEKIIGGAMAVHRALGSGFLESVYANALAVELKAAGLDFEREAKIDVFYRDQPVGEFRADLLFEGRVIVELKAVEQLNKLHEVQTVNYLTATGIDTGLLINFGAESLQVRRKVRTLHKSNPQAILQPVQS